MRKGTSHFGVKIMLLLIFVIASVCSAGDCEVMFGLPHRLVVGL